MLIKLSELQESISAVNDSSLILTTTVAGEKLSGQPLEPVHKLDLCTAGVTPWVLLIGQPRQTLGKCPFFPHVEHVTF